MLPLSFPRVAAGSACVVVLAGSIGACLSSGNGGSPLIPGFDGAIPPLDGAIPSFDGAIPALDGFVIPDSLPPSEGAAPDSAVADAALPPPTYNDMTNASFWSAFDSTTVNAGAKGFEGSVFDGRYVYFVPYSGAQTGVVARYDTQAPFGTAASWSAFDLTTVDPNAKGYAGAAFDGRYVYLAPRAGAANLIARYDTQAPFGTGGSWLTFNTTAVSAAANGFVGATFDGRYVYFVPYNNSSNAYHGVVTRYDTQASFAVAGSWSIFDTSTVDPNAKGFYGAVFDGHYVYFVPWKSGTVDGGAPAYSGLVTRYDTGATFGTGASWSTFDTTTLGATVKGFSGGAFDGRYLYLVPGLNGVVVEYDTAAAFGTAGSWTSFDATTVNSGALGFTGATFDGRYVYFAPYSNTTYDGLVARYDTQAGFAAGASWSIFDTSAVNPSSVGFIGDVFDGRYVYFVPCCNSGYTGAVTRFDSRSPASLPNLYGDAGPRWPGSFL